ncbi:MAG TPA: transcriptional regulator [Alcanivorax sp.]|jgi:DNA-binding HxlR family transcriptional regulator|nr:transcriptional regulator [Alcanivorax sp.]|tara:strand:+ start:282 stop:740 length:459 start_codon:yes stop_codon:yes gene_type:complete
MVRKRFPDTHCSVARALNDVGDWWSLLVVKEAMLGTRRFVDFQQNLGIARNILCDRLARLLENGVLIKQDVGEHGTRYEYRLTDKGRDLFTVITALRQWSDRWNGESGGPELVDRANGEPVPTVAVQSRDGRTLDVRAVVYREPSDTDSAAG